MIDRNDEEWIHEVEKCHKMLKNSTRIKSFWVAQELMILAGGDIELVVKAAKEAPGLDQTKHLIIDERMSRIESDLYDDQENVSNI